MYIIFNLLLLVCVAHGARILGVVLTPSYSHQIVFKPLWRELSLRGHQVTTLTTHPLKDPSLVNLTEIDLSSFAVAGSQDDKVKKTIKGAEKHFTRAVYEIFDVLTSWLDKQLDYPPVKQLINDKNAKFDVVIAEFLLPSSLAFAHRFDCPAIGMISLDALNWMCKVIGNPTHTSLFPDNFLPYGDKLSLVERIWSFVFDIGFDWFMQNVIHVKEQKIIEKHFGSPHPTMKEMSDNISMIFVNSDRIFHHARALVPTLVQVGGGSHKSAPKPLPKDLQIALDKATNGFIYFSLGSIVKSEFLPLETINEILDVFAELPYTVVWKLGEEISKKPDNVIFLKWVPQEDVMAHPNIKLFITHGGLQSMDEAIFEHVPMIGIPFFGDQYFNVKKMAKKGFGLQLDYKNFNRNKFKEAILEVINNPKYRDTVKKLAELAQDEPMTGLERAVWWTEYVIRHKGTKHLRSPLLDIPWYQYYLLDVIGVLFLAVLLIVYFVYFIIRSVVRFVKSKCCTKFDKKKVKEN